MLQIAEGELQRIILDIHDGPVQNMYAALSQINLLQKALDRLTVPPDSCAELMQRAERVEGLLEQSLSEVKTFISTFRAPEFQRRDLVSILEGLIIQHEELTGTTVTLSVDGTIPDVSLPAKIALYRIVQEALSNAYRHAGVDSHEVRLLGDDESIAMEVVDEGIGFDAEMFTAESQADLGAHIGLRGMQERARLLGGSFCVDSRPGRGTVIRVRLPAITSST